MGEVKVVFNVLCNKRIRILRLEALIGQLIEINPKFISIRLRGNFAEEAQTILERKFLDSQYFSFRIQKGTKYKSWKMNTLDQIIHHGPRTEYIAIFQEDFQFMVSSETVNLYVQESIRHDVDAIELLAGPFYGFSSPGLDELRKNRAFHVMSLDLNRMNIIKTGRVVHALTSWPAIYRESVIIKALNSNRPYFKKFNPDFPFDWEKSIKEKWLLPLKWCAPRFELLACIDYDSLWPGSSLQSRGVSSFYFNREDDTLDGVANSTLRIFKTLSKVLPSGRSEEVSSLHFHVRHAKHKVKRSLIYLHGLRYSIASIIHNLVRYDERLLKKLSKTKQVK